MSVDREQIVKLRDGRDMLLIAGSVDDQIDYVFVNEVVDGILYALDPDDELAVLGELGYT